MINHRIKVCQVARDQQGSKESNLDWPCTGPFRRVLAVFRLPNEQRRTSLITLSKLSQKDLISLCAFPLVPYSMCPPPVDPALAASACPQQSRRGAVRSLVPPQGLHQQLFDVFCLFSLKSDFVFMCFSS